FKSFDKRVIAVANSPSSSFRLVDSSTSWLPLLNASVAFFILTNGCVMTFESTITVMMVKMTVTNTMNKNCRVRLLMMSLIWLLSTNMNTCPLCVPSMIIGLSVATYFSSSQTDSSMTPSSGTWSLSVCSITAAIFGSIGLELVTTSPFRSVMTTIKSDSDSMMAT